MRVSYSGNMSGFHPEDVDSISATRTNFKRRDNIMADEEKDLLRAWSAVPDVDRKAITGSIRAHVRQAKDRTATYKKDFEGNTDPVILKAHSDRINAAEVALQILGEDV